MARLQSEFVNLKAKVNKNVDRQINSQMDNTNSLAGSALQCGQKSNRVLILYLFWWI